MTKIKIQIKNRWTGSVLFEYEKNNNTIKDTLLEAIRLNANLYGADLSGADLSGAELYEANLYRANLSRAELYEANLREANLYGANLVRANLYGVNLYGADLSGADLYGANLVRANLYGVNLYGADLSEANLSKANLYGANLYGAKDIPYIPFACPSDGAFIGWKKVHGKLIKLEIPEDAKRCSATTQKCRCDKAMVLAITDLDGQNPITEIENISRSHHLLYKVGEMVYPDSFDDNRWEECSHGIYFFVNKQDAINYDLPKITIKNE